MSRSGDESATPPLRLTVESRHRHQIAAGVVWVSEKSLDGGIEIGREVEFTSVGGGKVLARARIAGVESVTSLGGGRGRKGGDVVYKVRIADVRGPGEP